MQDQTVVCDIGSGAVRTGFAGEDAPRSVLTCRKGAVDRGIVSNWDDTEKIWSKALSDELRVQPFGCSVLMTDTPLNPKANRYAHWCRSCVYKITALVPICCCVYAERK